MMYLSMVLIIKFIDSCLGFNLNFSLEDVEKNKIGFCFMVV